MFHIRNHLGEWERVYNEKERDREIERDTDRTSKDRTFFQRFAELRPSSGVTDETREGKTDQEVEWK